MSEQKAGLTRAQTLLVTSHMTNVAKIAQHMSGTIESEFSVDELRACGYFGLLKAARGFVPEQGAFMAYATPLIRGAIVDGVRRLSHMSRRQRQGYFAEAQKDWASFDQLQGAVVMADNQIETPDESPGVETQVQHHENLRHLAAAGAELTATTEREIFNLRFVEQRSFETIANVLDMSRSALSKRHAKAVVSVTEKFRRRQGLPPNDSVEPKSVKR